MSGPLFQPLANSFGGPAQRDLLVHEAREQAWATYHLNFPENARGFGPWENEQISYSDKRAGSIFGLGIVDNPFSQSEAERLSKLAHSRNETRAAVREAFNNGATWDALHDLLSGKDASTVARDLGEHYRVSWTSPAQAAAVTPSETPAQQAGGVLSFVISPLAYAFGWRL